MRILGLIAAFALASVAAQAGEGRSLSLNGVDQKLPGSLGKAAEVPKIAEAPKPPEPAKAAEAAPAAAPAAVDAPKAETPTYIQPPTYVQRPSVAPQPAAPKPAERREGQVTFDDGKAAAPAAAAPAATTTAAPATTTTEQPKQAKADKPRRKRVHWDEARIMREVYRYSGYAGMIGGW